MKKSSVVVAPPAPAPKVAAPAKNYVPAEVPSSSTSSTASHPGVESKVVQAQTIVVEEKKRSCGAREDVVEFGSVDDGGNDDDDDDDDDDILGEPSEDDGNNNDDDEFDDAAISKMSATDSSQPTNLDSDDEDLFRDIDDILKDI